MKIIGWTGQKNFCWSWKRPTALPNRKESKPLKICGNLTISSFIQTILLVLELHQIVRFTLADFTANREFHPAPKTLLFSCFPAIITSTIFRSNELKIVRKYFGNRVILGYSFSYETKSVSGILMCSCLSVSDGASFP